MFPMFAPLMTKYKSGTQATLFCLVCETKKSSGNYWKHLNREKYIECGDAWIAKIGRVPKNAQDAGTEKSLYERLNWII